MRPAAAAAVLVLAAAVAAVAAAAVVTAPAAAAAAAASAGGPDLAGMQLDGSSGEGRAVLLEFAARGGGGAASADPGHAAADLPPPQRPALERGWARTASGLHVLDGEGSLTMVTGGGTIVVRSADRSAVVLAVPAAGSAGQAGSRYSVTVYAPGGGGGGGGGGLEATVFDAVLGTGRGGTGGGIGGGGTGGGGTGGGGTGGGAPKPASGQEPGTPSAKGGGGAGADGRFPDALAAAVTVTERVPFDGKLVVQGRVYDASLNADPRVVPLGPGAVPGVPVAVTVTDKRTGQAILEWAGTADASGLFRAEHRWSNTDPAASLSVVVGIDGGRLVKERTAFYMGR